MTVVLFYDLLPLQMNNNGFLPTKIYITISIFFLRYLWMVELRQSLFVVENPKTTNVHYLITHRMELQALD